MSVLGLIMSFPLYLRSAMVRFPLNHICVTTMTGFVLKITIFVIDMTEYVFNMDAFVLNMKGLLP